MKFFKKANADFGDVFNLVDKLTPRNIDKIYGDLELRTHQLGDKLLRFDFDGLFAELNKDNHLRLALAWELPSWLTELIWLTKERAVAIHPSSRHKAMIFFQSPNRKPGGFSLAKSLLGEASEPTMSLDIVRNGRSTNIFAQSSEKVQNVHHLQVEKGLELPTGYKLISFPRTTMTFPFIFEVFAEIAKGVQSGQKIVIDLRQSPGGQLGAAALFLSAFVNREVFFVEIRGGRVIGKWSRDRLAKNGVEAQFDFTDVKPIVLIDRQTASSAEILAGVLKQMGSPVIGETSFGKGIFQTVETLNVSKTFRPLALPGERMREVIFTYGEIRLLTNKIPFHNRGIEPTHQAKTAAKILETIEQLPPSSKVNRTVRLNRRRCSVSYRLPF